MGSNKARLIAVKVICSVLLIAMCFSAVAGAIFYLI